MKSLTELDLQLARLFYPVLIVVALEERTTTYEGLKNLTKDAFPDHAHVVDRCTAQAVGRRLDVVRSFTSPRGYPDLTSLVLNRATGEVGSGYIGSPQAERKLVWEFDWKEAEPDFRLHVSSLEAVVASEQKKKKRLTKKQATAGMVAAALNIPFRTPRYAEREKIIRQIIEGSDPLDALHAVLGAPAPVRQSAPQSG